MPRLNVNRGFLCAVKDILINSIFVRKRKIRHTSFEIYRIFVFVDTNAMLVRKNDKAQMNVKRLPPGGSWRRRRLRENALE